MSWEKLSNRAYCWEDFDLSLGSGMWHLCVDREPDAIKQFKSNPDGSPPLAEVDLFLVAFFDHKISEVKYFRDLVEERIKGRS